MFFRTPLFRFFSHLSQGHIGKALTLQLSNAGVINPRSRHIIPRISLCAVHGKKSSSPSVSRLISRIAVICTVFGKVELPPVLCSFSQPQNCCRSEVFVDVLVKPSAHCSLLCIFSQLSSCPAHLETQTFACSSHGDRATKHATQHFTRPFYAVLNHKTSQKTVFHTLADCHPNLLKPS